MIRTSQTAVGTVPTLLTTLPSGVGSLSVVNAGTACIFIGAGGTTVTTSSGAPLAAGAAVSLSGYPAASSTQIWAVSAGSVPSVGLFYSLPQ